MNDHDHGILIAGCGYVGTQLGLELARAGKSVWGLRRSAERLPTAIAPLAADLLDIEGLTRVLPVGVDAVVYASSASGFDAASYRAAYVDGLRNLLQGLARCGAAPKRLIFVSSTGVYGQSSGEWVDEDSETHPSRPTGQILLEAERLALDSPYPAVVVRFSGIYGPGRTRMIEQLRDGRARLRGGLPQYTNRIHRDDCAHVLGHLLALPRPQPIYIGSDDDPAPRDEVVSWIAEQLGQPTPPVEPDSTDGLRISGQNKRCSNQRLRDSGCSLRYPSYRDGYATLLTP
jgi:nucleoside-diphosphate-sugar epimerase